MTAENTHHFDHLTIAVSKLKKIAEESMLVTSKSDKAALFCAVGTLTKDLEAAALPGMSEHIERSRWGICAILGYDTTNGHSRTQHLSWALGALEIIEHKLGRR